MDKSAFVAELSKLRAASTFLTLKGYHNEHSEIADHSIVFHMSYKNALEKSVSILENLTVSGDLEIQAKTELLASFKKSLLSMETTPMEELENGYTGFLDDDGKYIKGIKLHNTTDTLHIYGLGVQKRVLMPGMYPTKNQKPLTIAKDKLRALTPVGKFRQYKIHPDKVDSIQVQGLSLLPPE